jgi:hypothetical protein
MGLAAGYKGYAPDAAGPQMPQKYPNTGPNYQKFGEQKGWVYDPWHDKYTPDPNAQKNYLESQGLGPEKPPGLGATLGPIAAIGAATALGQGLGKDPSGFLGGFADLPGKAIDKIAALGEKGKGLLDLGSSPIQAVQAANAAAPTVAAQAANAPGLLGLSPSAEAAHAAEVASSAEQGATAAQAGTAGVGQGASFLGSAAPYLGAAGAGLGAYGLYNAMHEGRDFKSGALPGMALGGGLAAAAPLLGLGPVGWGVLAASTLGGGLLGGGLTSFFGDTDAWKGEGDKLSKLRDSGVFVPQGMGAEQLTHGRTRDELIDIAKATGSPEDVRYAETGDINALKGHGQSLTGFSAFAEKDPNWFNRSMDERTKIANAVLDAGAASMHKGSLDVDWDKGGPGLFGLAPQTTPSVVSDLPKRVDGKVRVSPGVYR